MEVFSIQKVFALLVSVILLVGLVSSDVALTYTPFILDADEDINNGQSVTITLFHLYPDRITANFSFCVDKAV